MEQKSNSEPQNVGAERPVVRIIDWLGVMGRILRLPILIILVLILGVCEHIWEMAKELIVDLPEIKKWILEVDHT